MSLRVSGGPGGGCLEHNALSGDIGGCVKRPLWLGANIFTLVIVALIFAVGREETTLALIRVVRAIVREGMHGLIDEQSKKMTEREIPSDIDDFHGSAFSQTTKTVIDDHFKSEGAILREDSSVDWGASAMRGE